MRSKYAMINLIKNKLRAAGQRDPMVMAVDACEENISEMKPAPADAPKIDPKDYPDETKVPPREGAIPKPKGKKKPRQPKIDYSKPLEYGVGPGKALIHYAPPKPKGGSKMKTEERTPAKDDPAFDIMRPGGKNSPYEKDGTPKKKKKPTGPTGGESQRTKDLLPKPEKTTPEPKKSVKPVISGAKAAMGTPGKKGLRYNPYGKGSTANPSNMSSTTGP